MGNERSVMIYKLLFYYKNVKGIRCESCCRRSCVQDRENIFSLILNFKQSFYYQSTYNCYQNDECLLIVIKIFKILTATTTLTSTNCAIKTNTTKKMGAMMVDTQQLRTQSTLLSQSSRRVSFMMPFQLSPVATLKRVRNAMPKLAK